MISDKELDGLLDAFGDFPPYSWERQAVTELKQWRELGREIIIEYESQQAGKGNPLTSAYLFLTLKTLLAQSQEKKD